MSSGCGLFALSSFTSVTRLVGFSMQVLWDHAAKRSLHGV